MKKEISSCLQSTVLISAVFLSISIFTNKSEAATVEDCSQNSPERKGRQQEIKNEIAELEEKSLSRQDKTQKMKAL